MPSRAGNLIRPVVVAVVAVVLVSLVGPSLLRAQSQRTANTLGLDSASSSPPASIADIAWLEGHWRGTGLGGVAEEVWLGPDAGAMPGTFRVVRDGALMFYEMIVIAEHEGSLVVRLKHFNADMTGWEEKNDMITFRLVRIAPGVAHFSGLTFRQETNDRMLAFVALRRDDGSLNELEFVFSRVR